MVVGEAVVSPAAPAPLDPPFSYPPNTAQIPLDSRYPSFAAVMDRVALSIPPLWRHELP
jgi:hypothetical protein